MRDIDIEKLIATTDSSNIYREHRVMLGVPKMKMKMRTRGPQKFMTPVTSGRVEQSLMHALHLITMHMQPRAQVPNSCLIDDGKIVDSPKLKHTRFQN